ncbi:transglutaminase domain-containing protein [Micromonospora sp. LOL_025]|uniref:transglutaminase domain-containing protein n=1 Tax=Micromonospora sp. LOL_025 TaxID=3345413 RepID=UPI003A89907D
MTAAGLCRGLDTLYAVPPEHRLDDVDRASARQVLGCDDHTLSVLLDRGLPASGDPGEERFDSRDLFNLALYSGTGTTVPEQAFAYSLRWMRSSTEELLAPRASRFALRIACAADACGPRPNSTLALPRPERCGGAVRDLTVEDADGVAAPSGDPGDTVTRTASQLAVTATVHTRGELAELRSPELRAIAAEFAAMDLRWVKLPEALQNDVGLVTTHGVASCDSASRYLAQLCRRAGIPAVTRIGWVVGMLDLVHAWVEVEDADGATKVIDPVFALFSATVRDTNPLLRDPAVALRTNRLIPTGLSTGRAVAEHRCADEPTAARLTTKILPAPTRPQEGS